MKLAIYGAQGIALGAFRALREIFPEQEILCFIVTETGENPTQLEGLPVVELGDFVKEKPREELEEIEVLIGTPENVMADIEENLDRAGICNHVRLDSLRWAEMTRNAFIRNGDYLPLSAYPVGCRGAKLHVFKMRHHNDSPLKTRYWDQEYVTTLQVGALGMPEIGADIRDNMGDGISEKNGNYSELTGLYWIWKNRLCTRKDEDYYGLAHYRRFLNLSEDDLLRLQDNDIDVVLPFPMPYAPNIGAHHRRYLSEEEWGAGVQALRECSPEYAEAFDGVLEQEYLYNYNIILAKRKVLEEYCAWLFPILFRAEEINDPKGRKSPDRFIGYIGENLETLYFTYHKDRLRIAHAGCRFLV